MAINLMDIPEQLERQQLRVGGQSELAALFLQYRARLEKIVRFRLDPRIRVRLDPADVLQETYLRVSGRIHEFLEDSEVSFFIWVRQQTVQTLIDLQRRQFRGKRSVNRETRFPLNAEVDSTSLSIAGFLMGQLTSPSAAAARSEESQRLQEALTAMHPIDREVLALRHFEQLTNNQVAEILGLSPTAASNRYLRAAARLSQLLNAIQPPD